MNLKVYRMWTSPLGLIIGCECLACPLWDWCALHTSGIERACWCQTPTYSPPYPHRPPPLCPSHLTLSWRGQFMLKFNWHVSVLKSLLSSAARITKRQWEALFPSKTCRCNSMFRWPKSKWFRLPYLSRFSERLGLLPVGTPKLVSALCKGGACRVLP